MTSPVDIRPDHLKIVQDILRTHLPTNVKVWVFGSRANWTTKDSSDLDLALEGDDKLKPKLMGAIADAFEDSELPYKVDVIDLNAVSDKFKRIVEEQKVALDVGQGEGWRKVTLGEVAEVIMGQSPKSEAYNKISIGLPFYQGVVDFGDRFVTPRIYCSSPKKIIQERDVLLSVRAPVGRVNLTKEKCSIGRGNAGLRHKGDLQDFLFYALKNSGNKLRDISSGTIFSSIGKSDIKNLELSLPPLPEQRAIAHILGTLDDKIELNRRMNETREAMAQAIFQSWFVDFDPVHAKKLALEAGFSEKQAKRACMATLSGLCSPAEYAESPEEMGGKLKKKLSSMTKKEEEKLMELAASFPCEFEKSELGEIPRGWRVDKLGNNIIILDSKRIPLPKRERMKRKGNIPYYGATKLIGYVSDFIFDEELVLMGEDGSVIDVNGYPFIQYVWGKSSVNNHAHVLKGKVYLNNSHLYFFLKQTKVSAFVTGTTQLKINQSNLKSIPIILADKEICKVYNCLCKSIINSKINNFEEITTLATLRDSLLPKLLSGKISVGGIKLNLPQKQEIA